MNAASLLLVPITSVAFLAAQDKAPDAQTDAKELLSGLMEETPAPAPMKSTGPETGLRTAHLQPASGLQSAARGLTPEDDWQKAFSRYSLKRP